MNTNCLLLAESLPPRVLSSLRDLPKRLLFSNEHLQMLLAGLHPGQALEDFEAPTPLLVVVAFGEIQLRLGDSRRVHREGEDFRLEPGSFCDLVAHGETDLLFFIPTNRSGHDACSFAVETARRTRSRQERAIGRERGSVAFANA
jgi:hypothetical protein